jgi:hypothetical protein
MEPRRVLALSSVCRRNADVVAHERRHRCETEQAAVLAEEVQSLLATFNEVRPRETLGQQRPLAVRRTDPHLYRG